MPQLPFHAAARRAVVLLSLPLLLGCRGHQTGNQTAGAAQTPKVNLFGSSGCSTVTPQFGAITVKFNSAKLLPFAAPAGGALAADATENVAYLAVPGPAPGPAILKLDIDTLTVTTFADAARFAGFDPAVSALSGLAILDGSTLLAIDSSTNRILAITENSVSAFAGLSSVSGGLADGSSASALFRFNSPTQIAVGGDGIVYVADPGNHRIRKVDAGFVSNLAGTGVPGFLDGSGTSARFDTPDGVAIECGGTLLIAEASHRIRRISFKLINNGFLGSQTVATVSSVAGTGSGGSIDGTGGPGGNAQIFSPGGLNVGKDGTIYWLDRGTGFIRKIAPGGGTPVVTTVYGAASVGPGTSFGLAGAFAHGLLVDSVNSQILEIP